jgi:hypothetical protein
LATLICLLFSVGLDPVWTPVSVATALALLLFVRLLALAQFRTLLRDAFAILSVARFNINLRCTGLC